MNKNTQPQPTHQVDVRVRPDFSFSCECRSCLLTVKIGTTLQGFYVTMADDPFSHVKDHFGRRVYVALVSVNFDDNANADDDVAWYTIRAEDLAPLTVKKETLSVKNDYSHHNEFASQVRYEDERHYEPDPYDADDAWR